MILNKRILIATDKTTVVSYLNKQGVHTHGTCVSWFGASWPAATLEPDIFRVASMLYSLSRRDQNNTEWFLHPQIFSMICKIWHKPMVDMFATKMNHKFPLNVSPVPDANALNIDALNISWEGLDGYVYCPVTLIPNVIQKNQRNASFYRDKPIANRGIPAWDLSLVHMALTKPYFQPIKDASLKLLTFKTVFLMALASGKRRGGAFLDIFFPQTQTSIEGGHYFSFSCISSRESVGF